MTQLNVRAEAARVLIQVLPFNRPNHSGRSLSEALNHNTLAVSERPLLQELCFGVCRWYNRLDKLASALLKHPFKSKDADIHALVLIGIYQLFYLRIPDHASIAETVEACRQLKKKWAVSVVNGILRNSQRRKTELEQQLPESDAIQYAHPQWLVDAINSAWPNSKHEILSANNDPGPMCLRVNLARQSRTDFMALLKANNIHAMAGALADSAVYLEKPIPVDKLPSFNEGGVSVQDEAAQLSAFLLNPQAGDRVLDACAAPGGKTCHLLEQQPAIAQLIALDQDAQRLLKVQDNLERLRLSAECRAESIETFASHYQGPLFDRILLDAPCSALGVIRRHPDIKWLRRRSDLNALAQTQHLLLKQVFGLLKPGGTLLYATCSVMPQENERQITKFLTAEPNAEQVPIELAQGAECSVGFQLLPKKTAYDGFYYARLQRKHSLC